MNINSDTHLLATTQELIQTIHDLHHQIKELRLAAQEKIEQNWFMYHENIKEAILEWKNSVLTKAFYTFHFQNSVLYYKPLLSDTDKQQFNPGIPISDMKKEIDQLLKAEVSQLILLALGSAEMQMNFFMRYTVIPLNIFDNICGFFVAHTPNITPKDYHKLCEHGKDLCENIRKSILEQEESSANKAKKWLSAS